MENNMTPVIISKGKSKKNSGFMLAYALAAVAMIGAGVTYMTTSANVATRTAASVNNRMQLSSTVNSLINSIARSGQLSAINMFFPPLPRLTTQFTAEYGGLIPSEFGTQTTPTGNYFRYCVWDNGYDAEPRDSSYVPTRDRAPVRINIDAALTYQQLMRAPSAAIIDPGKNSVSEITCGALTVEDDGIIRLKEPDEIRTLYTTSDDRVVGAYTMETLINMQGQGITNLVGGFQNCPWETHKLTYHQNDEGTTEFVCTPEQDPAINAVNLGAGFQLFADKNFIPDQDNIDEVVSDLKFRTLTAGSNVNLEYDDANNSIKINSIGGDINMDNVGPGEGAVFRNRVGDTFNLKTLKQGSNVTISNHADYIEISAAPGGGGTITSGANVGLPGGEIYEGATANQLVFRRLRSADGNLQITNDLVNRNVIIRNTMDVPVKGGINVGGNMIAGVPNTPPDKPGTKSIYIGIDANKKMAFRRLQSGTGIILSEGDGCTASGGGGLPSHGGHMAGGGAAPAIPSDITPAAHDALPFDDTADGSGSPITGCEKAIKISIDMGSIEFDEQDPRFVAWRNTVMPGSACGADQVIRWDGSRFICVDNHAAETDPVFLASRPIAACNGTANKITWNGTQFTCETDQTGAGGVNITHTGTGVELSNSGSTNNLIMKRIRGNGAISITESAGGIEINGTGASQWTTAGSNIHYSTGNVGIGTSTPRRKLDASGDIVAYNDASNFLMVHSNSALVYPSANNLRFGTVTDVPAAGGYPSWSEKMRITPAGNVGIGTSVPAEKLDVAGNIRASGVVRAGGGTNGITLGANSWSIHGAGHMIFGRYVDEASYPTEILRLTDTGNLITATGAGKVGIGTNAPGEKLSVVGNMSVVGNSYLDNIVSDGEVSTFGSYFVARDNNGSNDFNKTDISHQHLRIFTSTYGGGTSPTITLGNNGVIEAGVVNSRGNVTGAYLQSSGAIQAGTNISAAGTIGAAGAITAGGSITGGIIRSNGTHNGLTLGGNAWSMHGAGDLILGQYVSDSAYPRDVFRITNAGMVRIGAYPADTNATKLDVLGRIKTVGLTFQSPTSASHQMTIYPQAIDSMLEAIETQQPSSYNDNIGNLNNLFYFWNDALDDHARIGVEKLYAYAGIATKHGGIDLNYFRTDAGHEHDYIRGFRLYSYPTNSPSIHNPLGGDYVLEMKTPRVAAPMAPENTFVIRTQDNLLGNIKVRGIATEEAVQGPAMNGSQFGSTVSVSMTMAENVKAQNIALDNTVKFVSVKGICTSFMNDGITYTVQVRVRFNAGFTEDIYVCKIDKYEDISNGRLELTQTQFVPVPTGATAATVTVQRTNSAGGNNATAEVRAIR